MGQREEKQINEELVLSENKVTSKTITTPPFTSLVQLQFFLLT